MVTRTINVTIADCMLCNIRTATVSHAVLEVVGKLEGEALLQELRSLYDNEEDKIVAVQHVQVDERLYGLSEALFMAMGTLLPSRVKQDENREEA